MLKKFFHGLIFGAGAGIAFIAILLVSLIYVIPPALDKMTNKSPDMSGAKEAIALPVKPIKSQSRGYTLHKGGEIERKIPPGGGMLSISVLEDDGKQERPSTFQAWVTESEAYIINTKEDTPTIKNVTYPKTKVVDYANKLVSDNVGFKEQNMTISITGVDVRLLKNGLTTKLDKFYNGKFRITEEDVVFFLPNKYIHNEELSITGQNIDPKLSLETDKKYQKNIVGFWVDSPKDESFGYLGHITEYLKDGSVHFRGYLDGECTIQDAEIFGEWKIINSNLIITVTKSDNQNISIGEVITDNIIDINSDEMILISAESGTKQFRQRSDKCLYSR